MYLMLTATSFKAFDTHVIAGAHYKIYNTQVPGTLQDTRTCNILCINAGVSIRCKKQQICHLSQMCCLVGQLRRCWGRGFTNHYFLLSKQVIKKNEINMKLVLSNGLELNYNEFRLYLKYVVLYSHLGHLASLSASSLHLRHIHRHVPHHNCPCHSGSAP